MPRVSVTAGYYRRQFYNLQIIDNQNVSSERLESVHDLGADLDPRLPTSGQPIALYNLNANKVGTAIDNLYTFFDLNQATYNGFEVSANVRFNKRSCSAASRPIAGRPRRATVRSRRTASRMRAPGHPRATTRTRCASATPSRRSAPRSRLSAAYNLPYDFQVSGSFLAIPGPSVNANYAVTGGHRRTPDRRLDRPAPTRSLST